MNSDNMPVEMPVTGGDSFSSPSERAVRRLLVLSRTALFTGMGLDELQRIVGKTKIDFLKFAKGDEIARQGEKCGKLMVLLTGNVECTGTTDNGAYSVTETIPAPATLQIDSIFGLFQMFTHTYTAATDVSLISIGKGELMKLASSSVVFRLNLVNNLSTSLQKMRYDVWRTGQGSIRERIVSFFRHHCIVPSGQKTFRIKMVTFAQELNCRRQQVSRALHDMQGNGLLTLHRGRIEIPALQKLLVGM